MSCVAMYEFKKPICFVFIQGFFYFFIFGYQIEKLNI